MAEQHIDRGEIDRGEHQFVIEKNTGRNVGK